jgi:hypothetical protein
MYPRISQMRPRIRATLKAVPLRVTIQVTMKPIREAEKMARKAALGAKSRRYW